MTLKFAANLSFMFTEVSFPERFEAAASAGFTGVEFLFPYVYSPTEIADFVRRAGVTLALHNLPPGDWAAGDRGMAAIAGRRDEFKRSVDTALHYAEATGLKQIHIMAGCISDEDRRTAMDVYRDNLTYAASRFAEVGITALIEPINTIDMPGYFLNDTYLAQKLIREVNASNLRLQFDCYHSQITSGDALGTLTKCYPDVAHVQIASAPDRHEPDHGDCDYNAVFDTLEGLQYAGWIGCEYHPQGKTEDGLAWGQRWI